MRAVSLSCLPPIPHLPSPNLRITELLAEVERKWGRGALVRWGDAVEEGWVETVPTGFPELDEAIGIGGLPCGRISELFGVDSSGKQALAAAIAVQCQKQQGVVTWIDPAGRLDPEQARAWGVQPETLLVARPRNELEALEMAVRLARSGGIKLLVFDLAFRGPGFEQDGQDGNGWPGWGRKSEGAAALSDSVGRALPSLSPSLPLSPSPAPPLSPSLSLALRRLVAAVHKNRIAFLFIAGSPSPQNSELRTQNPAQSSVPSPQSSTHHSRGGQALRYFASVRLEIERREWIRRGKEVVGCRSAVRVVKNKLAPPHREAEVDLWFYRFPPEKPAVATFTPAHRP